VSTVAIADSGWWAWWQRSIQLPGSSAWHAGTPARRHAGTLARWHAGIVTISQTPSSGSQHEVLDDRLTLALPATGRPISSGTIDPFHGGVVADVCIPVP